MCVLLNWPLGFALKAPKVLFYARFVAEVLTVILESTYLPIFVEIFNFFQNHLYLS